MKEAISKRKSELMEQRVNDCEGDQKKLFSLIHSLLGSKKNTDKEEYFFCRLYSIYHMQDIYISAFDVTFHRNDTS